MRSMKSKMKNMMIITIPLLAGLLLVGLVSTVMAGNMPSTTTHADTTDSFPQLERAAVPNSIHLAPAIRPSLRISIPYGFAPTQPLRAGGEEVVVRGHGSCTAGETFTVAVTVTHTATGYTAHGEITEPCAGEEQLQNWQLTATADSAPLSRGPGEVCGLVQTLDGENVTDEQEWCVDVRLGDYVFLPAVIR